MKVDINIASDCRGWNASDVVEQVLEDREIEDTEHFLNPRKDDLLPIYDLKNIRQGAETALAALQQGLKIGILADVDLDGVTSAAIIYRYLKMQDSKANIVTFINHGKAHGMDHNDLDKYKDCKLLIVVDSLDNRITNYRDVQKDSEILGVIVLDHHTINKKIPYDDYVILISSMRDYGNPSLSGAGVCLKFVMCMDDICGTDYADDLYDLAGSGLVGDMMDVTVPENRYIISKALEEIHNPAIEKMVGSGFGWNSKSISFSVAPLVNASMRLDKNEYSLKAFLSDNEEVVANSIKVLNKCKEAQNKEIENLMEEALKQCESQIKHNRKILMCRINTDIGVAGLLANKLMDKYKRPVVVLKEDGDIYRGSMRAVGVDSFLDIINTSNLGRAFGHENAAGVEIYKRNLRPFRDYMERVLPDFGVYVPTIEADVWVNAKDINKAYIDEIQKLNNISGTGFPSVTFYIEGIRDYEIKDMSKGKHLKIVLPDTDFRLVEWNFTGDWEELREAAEKKREIECVVELQNSMIKDCRVMGVMRWYNIKEEEVKVEEDEDDWDEVI